MTKKSTPNGAMFMSNGYLDRILSSPFISLFIWIQE